jgi:hypothetical protein
MNARLAALAALLVALPARAELPDAWLGTWTGSCTTGAPGTPGEPLGMDLEVAPAPEGTGWAWRTTYHQPGQAPQLRDYRLLPTDQPARFLVDERNGIVLDAVLHQDVLYQNFYLPSNGRTLPVRWERRGNTLEVEMPVYATRPGRTTTGPGGIQVTSFSMLSLQRCSLTRSR